MTTTTNKRQNKSKVLNKNMYGNKGKNNTQLPVRVKVVEDIKEIQTTSAEIHLEDMKDEKALIASENRYRRLFESAKDGILILDADTGMIVDVNPFLINLLGFSKEQFINKAIWEIGYFKDILANKEKFLELQKKDYVRYENLPLETADGRKINVEFVSNVYSADNNKVIQCNIRDITQRRQNEETLHEAKEKLERRVLKRTEEFTKNKQLLDDTGRLARVGGWEIDIKKNELTWSDIVYQIHEVEPDYKPTIQSSLNFFTKESIPIITEALKQAIENGQSFDVDLKLITAKQNTIWVRKIGQAYRVNGEIVKIGGVFHDINERKLAELQLIIATKELIFQKEEKENRAAELVIADKELAYQSGEKENRAAELLIANKELIFQNREKENRAAELSIANKELVFQNKEKENRAAELIIANKELVFQNKEKEKRAAELLIANKELAFQNVEKEKRAAELIIANKELAFQNVEKEKRAAELLIANEELAYQNLEKEKRAAELLIANEELVFQNEEKEKRAAELIIANEELAFQNIEKEKRAAELLIANKELIFQNEEKEKRAIELSKAKEKAEESDKLKTAFLQNMSHEIRTPLNGIIGFSGLLNTDNLSKEDIKEFTSMISQSGQRLIEIVNNVLDISKIQIGQVQIEQKPILINGIFTDLFTFFSRFAEEKGIVLNYHNIDDKYRTIYSDETKLNQILTNLINNAIKFTKSGSIDFGYEIKDGFIQLYVKDTGSGIPPEFFDRIFDRFTQADLSITRGYEGAGLGLAICKGLVELLGGKIWLESEVNKGTTFFFTLPHTEDTDIELQSLSESLILDSPQILTGHENQNKGIILIAEDDRISFQYLDKLLENADVTVIHAEDGSQAVEIVRNNPDIDLILMDIRMPVMDGMEATRLIKQIRPDLPIIAQTAYAFSEEKERILASGCDEYLAKPIKNDMLQLFIDKYLN